MSCNSPPAGGNVAQVAKELWICDSTLGNWVRAAREQAEGAPTAADRAEVRDLRRELERVTREQDLLAKAVGLSWTATAVDRASALVGTVRARLRSRSRSDGRVQGRDLTHPGCSRR